VNRSGLTKNTPTEGSGPQYAETYKNDHPYIFFFHDCNLLKMLD